MRLILAALVGFATGSTPCRDLGEELESFRDISESFNDYDLQPQNIASYQEGFAWRYRGTDPQTGRTGIVVMCFKTPDIMREKFSGGKRAFLDAIRKAIGEARVSVESLLSDAVSYRHSYHLLKVDDDYRNGSRAFCSRNGYMFGEMQNFSFDAVTACKALHRISDLIFYNEVRGPSFASVSHHGQLPSRYS